MDGDILRMASQLNLIWQKAYNVYLPIVEDLCNREASEEELTHCLDYMLDFACEERMLELYKRLCRKYLYIYPTSIKFYIDSYREMWDAE